MEARYEPKIKKGALYLLMDGHLRYAALQAIGETEAKCLLVKDNECFTYNARVNRLSAIQENAMITKAIKAGVSPESIAEALNLDMSRVRSIINLLQGIHPDAAELLKDKPITRSAITVMKRVTGARQIEMARFMNSMRNYSLGYVRGMVEMSLPKDVIEKEKPKKKAILTAEDQAKMEDEIFRIEQEFQVSEEDFGKKMLHLSFAKAFVKKLLNCVKVERFLRTRYSDICDQFDRITRVDTM